MTINFVLSRRAHARALRDVTRRTRSYKLSLVFFVVLPAAMIGYALLSSKQMETFVLDNLAFLLLGPLLVFVGFPLTYSMQVSRIHKNNAMLKSPQTFELTPAHLSMRGPLHNSDLKWDAVYRVVETRDNFLFFISKYAAHFIPKETLRADEIVALRERLTELLPGRVDLRSASDAAEHAAA